jgi:hypothetical protein
VRTRKQMVDRHRRLRNEAEALIGELPSRLIERPPSGESVAPRLAAAARLHADLVGVVPVQIEPARGEVALCALDAVSARSEPDRVRASGRRIVQDCQHRRLVPSAA